MYSSTFISWKSIVTTAMPSPSTSILKLSAHTQPQHQLTSPLSTQSNTQRQRWRSNQTIRRSKPFKDVRPKSNQSINHNAEGTLRNFPDQKYATRNLASEKKDSPVLADAELMARKPATPVHNNRVEGGGGYMLSPVQSTHILNKPRHTPCERFVHRVPYQHSHPMYCSLHSPTAGHGVVRINSRKIGEGVWARTRARHGWKGLGLGDGTNVPRCHCLDVTHGQARQRSHCHL